MIAIQSVVKRFGPLEVLRGVSLGVRKAEVSVIIGGSGSGKSTLLRCINGLERHDAGTIEVDGMVVPRPGDAGEAAALCALRKRVGMVFQQFNLFPHMSVLENVMCGPRKVLGIAKDEAESLARTLLDRVGLADRVHQRPTTLSGGQQQRVAIARTLANQPDVILFDEPTSALDPKMTAEVLAVMADLAAEGQTMVVVSHAMGFVKRSAHTVHVFASGQIVESGPPEQVMEAPVHAQTRELLAQAHL